MSTEDLLERIEKLEYQIRVITETIDFDEYPVEYLILTLNWSEEDLDRIGDVFDNYDNQIASGQKIRWGQFEKDLNTDYQTVKRIIKAFYKNNQWNQVCVEYTKSLAPNIPTELQKIV